nr:MAG TPA: hypothetical protein [Caudoviricetes sp.]
MIRFTYFPRYVNGSCICFTYILRVCEISVAFRFGLLQPSKSRIWF